MIPVTCIKQPPSFPKHIGDNEALGEIPLDGPIVLVIRMFLLEAITFDKIIFCPAPIFTYSGLYLIFHAITGFIRNVKGLRGAMHDIS